MISLAKYVVTGTLHEHNRCERGNTMNEIELEEMAETVFERAGYDVVGANIVESSDTLQDFITKWGQPHNIIGNASVWENLQTRKGAVRGDLVVVETESGSATYFSGQA